MLVDVLALALFGFQEEVNVHKSEAAWSLNFLWGDRNKVCIVSLAYVNMFRNTTSLPFIPLRVVRGFGLICIDDEARVVPSVTGAEEIR